MTDLLITARFTSHSGDVDEQENRWTVHSDVPGWPLAADVDALKAWLDTFYATDMASVWSNELSGSASPKYDFYDISGHLNGTPHGPPIFMRDGEGLSVGGDGLPGQIAIVVDYHADLSGIAEFGPGTRPRARRRGRHYHGPIESGRTESDTSTKIVRWNTTTMDAIKLGYEHLLSGVPSGVEWTVWSRKDAAVYPVIGGWVDTTPRRARRREEPTNVKILWP